MLVFLASTAMVVLAAKYNDPLAILLGTTTGMLIADAIGI